MVQQFHTRWNPYPYPEAMSAKVSPYSTHLPYRTKEEAKNEIVDLS